MVGTGVNTGGRPLEAVDESEGNPLSDDSGARDGLAVTTTGGDGLSLSLSLSLSDVGAADTALERNDDDAPRGDSFLLQHAARSRSTITQHDHTLKHVGAHA